MKVEAIHLNKFLKKTDDIYENVVVAAKRARQIIDSRAIDFDALDDVEDSNELVELEISTEDLEKPMMIAVEELIDDQLVWRRPEDSE